MRSGVSRLRAHPRSRGENRSSTRPLTHFPGSSPLTRGKPSVVRRERSRSGLIPAHAGKTMRPPARSYGRTAHPRSRGENWFADAAKGVADGSSPLTRGKRRAQQLIGDSQRLIPAHAGKTRLPVRTVRRVRAHPRSRGENQKKATNTPGPTGSSPLTRGKPG